LNRGMKDLQSFALPLGHAAVYLGRTRYIPLFVFRVNGKFHYFAITLMNLYR
jgi:hypothetical protein